MAEAITEKGVRELAREQNALQYRIDKLNKELEKKLTDRLVQLAQAKNYVSGKANQKVIEDEIMRVIGLTPVDDEPEVEAPEVAEEV